MADLVLTGNTSGTVTVSVPAVAGTNTVTIAAQTGTLNAAAPAISATPSTTQNISASTITKVTLGTEDFDTNNCFASSTFTPNVAGYYLVTGQTLISASTTITNTAVYIYKNGSTYQLNAGAPVSSTSAYGFTSCVIYMNGTTDYIELYGRCVGTGTITIQTSSQLTAALIRGE